MNNAWPYVAADVGRCDHVVDGQRKAALLYFEDGCVDMAIPPLKALLNILAHGEYEGMTLRSPEV